MHDQLVHQQPARGGPRGHSGYAMAAVAHFSQLMVVIALRAVHTDDVFWLPCRWVEQRGPPRAGEDTADLVTGGGVDTSFFAAGFFLISSVLCCLMATGSYDARGRAIRGEPDGARWAMYTAAGLQFVIIAAMCGVRDPLVLACLALGMATLQVFGYLLEKYPRDGTLLLIASWLLYGALWVPVLGGYARVASEAPNFVHALVTTQFCLFSAFGLVAMWRLWQPDSGPAVLRAYLFLDVVSKSLNCWITLSGQLAM